MNRKECLDAAAEAVLKNRQATYGPPENSFADTAVVWSVILGVEVKPWQIPLMLAGLKVVRAKASPQHDDNWVDLAGYAACGAELATLITEDQCAHTPYRVGRIWFCTKCGKDVMYEAR